jgi:rhodanese-related sulfurtransferase
MKLMNTLTLAVSIFALSFSALAEEKAETQAADELNVKITAELPNVEIKQGDQTILIQRDQNKDHRIGDGYDKTSRACPPFCIQPASAAENVDTVAELEVIEHLKNGDMLIDTRTAAWLARGYIPGAVNIPWKAFNTAAAQAWSEEITVKEIADVMVEKLGVTKNGDALDFANAANIIMYCNGPWCPQSVNAIKSLIAEGYPAEKIKWYRGGMQAWESFGLTVIKG